jgi:hypothetical protein
MADKMRWRYGDTNPMVAAVDAETVIEIGDMLWLDVDDAKPACMSQNPVQVAMCFLGVAMQRSREGQTDPIHVATSGVFDMDCPLDTYELGDLVGAIQFADKPVCNQRIAKAAKGASAYTAIGRVDKREVRPTGSVYVRIYSAVMGPIR